MLLVTHEMGFAKAAASKVVFMDDGRIVEVGTPDEVFSHPKSDRTKQFLEHIL
jgi:polar amino acid transport system ATP-binding protein